MKKGIIFVLAFCFLICPIQANTKEEVTLAYCTDGDTAHFYIDGKDTKVRFLAINAPEYTKEHEAYGKEASEYTCNALKQADTITLEYDDGSDAADKYDRTLAWVFVDDVLLEKELVEQGLAEVKYIYGDYAYTNELKKLEKEAKAQKLGMWTDTNVEEEEDDIPYYMAIILGAICVFAGIFLIKNKHDKRKIIAQGMRGMKRK